MAVKILAADDSATLRRVLQMTFAGEAVEVQAVDSGEAAVERALQLAPDLVIADVSMSMDGYEVSRAIKSNAATQNVAVIVLASQHHPYDAEKGKQAGVDDHILKPYDSQAMIEKAKEVLARPRNRAAGGVAAVAAAPARPPGLPQPAAHPPPRPPLPGTGTQPHATAPAAPRPQSPGVGRPQTAAQVAQNAAPTRATVAFGGGPQPAAPVAVKPAPAAPVAPAAPAPVAAAPKPAAAAPVRAAAAATAPSGEMAARLSDLGLSREQVEGVLGLSREIIERVVWEVVPDLAETIIREEIKRLTAE